MRELAQLLRHSSEWLVERVQDHARERGFTRYTPVLRMAWRDSVEGLSAALRQALPGGLSSLELTADDSLPPGSLKGFAVEEARLHRARKVSLGMFLGLLACYRQGYLDLVDRDEGMAPGLKAESSLFLTRFFERLAAEVSVAWTEAAEPAQEEEFRQEALNAQNERQRMRAVFHALPSAVLLADPQGLVTDLNEAACRWLSQNATQCVRREEFLGRNMEELLPWVGPALARVRAGGYHEPPQDGQGDMGSLHTGEKLAFLDTRIYPLFGLGGGFEGMVVVLQDVTALRDASESQARIASELRGQLREASSLNRIADVLGQHVDSVEELLTNLARALPACLDAAESLAAVINFDGQEYASDAGPEPAACGSSVEEPLAVLGRANGFIRLCCPEGGRAFTQEEAPLLAAIARQVEHVLETRLSLTLLSQSERQFREFFNSAADAIFIHDGAGFILDANRNAGIWLNTPTESLGGRNLLESVAEAEREAVSARFVNALRGEPELFQATLLRRDGFAIPAEFLCQVQNYQGQPALITSGRNITGRLRTQAEIERRLETEGLVSGISSRLNNAAEADTGRAIEDSLADICRFLGMNRGAVYLLDGKRSGFDRAYRYYAGKQPGQEKDLARFSRRTMPWFAERILAGERVFIRDATHMPPAGGKEKQILGRMGIASMAAIPLTVKDRLLGALAVASDAAQDASHLSESRVLDQTAMLLANAIERRAAAAALRQSEALARAIIDSLAANICVLDRRGTLTMVNRSWAATGPESTPLGAQGGLDLGGNYLETCRRTPGNAHAAATLEGILSVLSRRAKSFRQEYPGLVRGEKRWFVLQVTPLSRGAGGAVVSHRDITERMRAIAELRESEERFRIIVETAQEAVMNLNAEGRVTYANPRAETLFGYLREELAAMSIYDLADPADHPLLDKNIERRRQGHSDRYELRFRHKNGHRIWTMLNASAMQTPDGSFAGSVGMITDISDRVRAEIRLRRNEARYRSLVESMHEGLVMARRTGLVTYVNDRFCAMLGRPRNEITGRAMADFVDDASRTRLATMLAESQSSAPADRAGSEEIIWEHATGRHIYSLVSPSAYADEEGKPAGFFAVVTDTTDRKGLESQLLQSQKLEAIGQLAAGIAHEINTPAQYVGNNTQFIKGAFEDVLAVIEATKAFLDASADACPGKEDIAGLKKLMEERDVDYLASEVPGAIAQTLEGVERISTIVRSVKQFAHPGLAVMAPADLNESMKSTATVSRNEWKYVAELDLDLDPALPMVVCMIGEINQVVLNLIINAAHAIADAKKAEPEREGRITLSTRRAGPWAEIRVRDTGTGIPAAVQARIFDPFFTTKEVGRGTGQGLTISRGIVVEKHKGQLFFETTEGQGTTFVVRLPLEQETQSEEA